jgi:hypothetical protein
MTEATDENVRVLLGWTDLYRYAPDVQEQPEYSAVMSPVVAEMRAVFQHEAIRWAVELGRVEMEIDRESSK